MDRLGRDDLFYKIADFKENEALSMLSDIDDVNFQDKNGFSYLHIAAQSKLSKVVEALLQKGAQVDIRDKFGRTPLIISILNYNGDRTIIDMFLKYEADPDIAVPSGMTARKLADNIGFTL